jgi:hypothetical protein
VTPTADLIAEITDRCERVLMQALPADLPGRLMVLPMLPSENYWGLAVGDGRLSALANGGTVLDRAFRMNVAAILAYHAEHEEAVAVCLSVAAHELGHLLVAAPDRAATTAEAVAFWNEVLITQPTRGASLHCARWAGSFFVIVHHLKNVLPAREHRAVIRHAWAGLRGYGFEPLAMLDALDGLSLPELVGEAFAHGAPASIAVAGVSDDDPARQAWMDRANRKTLADVASAA